MDTGDIMTPDRKAVVNGRKVEEYYWAGEYVTYIDNHLFNGSFAAAIKSVETTPIIFDEAEQHPYSGL